MARKGRGAKKTIDERLKHNPETGCLDWTGCCDTWGYGTVSIGGKMYQVHRVVYERALGKLPVGIKLLHECDRPCCANILHLRPGTQADNIHDMMRKGRAKFGGKAMPPRRS